MFLRNERNIDIFNYFILCFASVIQPILYFKKQCFEHQNKNMRTDLYFNYEYFNKKINTNWIFLLPNLNKYHISHLLSIYLNAIAICNDK